MSAIVTFGRNRIAYTICKSLHGHGIKVITCDSVYPAMSYFSKSSSSYFVYPPFAHDPIGCAKTLLTAVKRLRTKVLMPVHDEGLVIAYFKETFEKFTKVTSPSYEKLSIARDKNKVAAIAQALNIPVPETHSVRNIDDVKRLSGEIRYPVVIKVPRGRGAWGVRYATTKEELVREYGATLTELGDSAGTPFIQEYIDGDGYGVSMLFNQGDCRAQFVHKRLMELPITGGTSVERVSAKNPTMVEHAKRLLSYLGWHGVAMVEFKLERKTKRPVLLEVNPRFWGSLNQAVVAGVDFPYLLYRMAVEGDVEPVLQYRVGVRTRWLFGQLNSMMNVLIRKRSWKTLAGYNLALRGVRYDDLTLDDPLPFLFEPLPYLMNVLKKGSLDTFESVDYALERVAKEDALGLL